MRHTYTRFFLLLAFPLLLGLLLACSASPQHSLNVRLPETPLFPQNQWGLVTVPYSKVNSEHNNDSENRLVGMVHYGAIVQVEQIVSADDKAYWAYIRWWNQAEGSSRQLGSGGTESGNAQNQEEKANGETEGPGWIPLNFLHLVRNHEEAVLSSRLMLANRLPLSTLQNPEENF